MAEAGFKDSAVNKPALFSKDSDFRHRPNDGKLSQPWVSTAVLHRPNPVARETPGFIGFFARRDQVAEREGFAPPLKLFAQHLVTLIRVVVRPISGRKKTTSRWGEL
jgi:hypothetical protein